MCVSAPYRLLCEIQASGNGKSPTAESAVIFELALSRGHRRLLRLLGGKRHLQLMYSERIEILNIYSIPVIYFLFMLNTLSVL